MVKQVIVLRKDLGMRKGKMVAQGAHASLGAAFERGKHFSEWMNSGAAKICVSCESEQELLDLFKQAKESGLPYYLVRDAGKTEFHGVSTLTALAIGPGKEEDIDKITGDLKLL